MNFFYINLTFNQIWVEEHSKTLIHRRKQQADYKTKKLDLKQKQRL